MTYWYAPGMAEPYWAEYTALDYPTKGEAVEVFHNLSAETDMGDLYGPEFHDYFPHAFEIAEEQLWKINPVEGIAWALFLKKAADA